jgi:hypothetical protein
VADVASIRSTTRLSGLVEDPAANIVKPAMIEAPEPTVFDATVTEICPAVRTMKPEQSGASLIVAE